MSEANHVSRVDTGREELSPQARFLSIALDQIEAEDQVRKRFDDEGIRQLADSLRAAGQLQPILAFRDEVRDKYVVVAGGRRLQAARLAGLQKLDCIVFPHRPSPAEIATVQIVENEIRESLNSIEQANGFHLVMQHRGWSARQLAEHLHIAPTTVTRALALLGLPGDLQGQIANGLLPPAIARELARLPTEEQRRTVLDQVQTANLTASQAARLVSKLLRTKSGTGKKARSSKTIFRLAGGFEATLTPQRLVLAASSAKKPRSPEEIIGALERLLTKLRQGAPSEVQPVDS